MALTFTSGAFGPKTDVSYIDIGTDALILEDNLTAFDQKHLEAALAEVSLADYDMPNGQQTAADYFTPKTRTAAEITEQYQQATYIGNTAAEIANIVATYNTHTHGASADAPNETI